MMRRPKTDKHYLPFAAGTLEELPKVNHENDTPSHIVVRPVGDGIMQFQLCFGNRVVTRWLAPWEEN